jgi:predicted dehydrogenase
LNCYDTFVKIGMIGLGFIGATHYKAFSAIDGVSVAAVCANNPRALDGDLTEVGGNLGRPTEKYDFSALRKHRQWQQIIEDPDLDAVDICLPTNLHFSVAMAAMNAGKHVLCEKPMALSGKDCDGMIAAASETRRVLMVGQVLRFWPEYKYLNSFVHSGEYGAVRTATLVRRCAIPDWSKWLLDEKQSGGALLDLLVHDIDQALLVFGVPAKVAAKSLGDFDTVSATLIYPGGPEVRIQGGWFPPGTPFAMGFHVLAERGELELTPDGLRLNDRFGASNRIKAEGPDAYEAEVRYFVDCCRDGKPPERCPPEASARAVKLALLMKQSRAEGGKQITCEV